MKNKNILIIILCIIICVGCSQGKEITQEEKKLSEEQITVSTGMRFYVNGTTVKEQNINITSNTLDIELDIDNDYPFENKYTLIILNNGKQENYYIDKQMYLDPSQKQKPPLQREVNLGICENK